MTPALVAREIEVFCASEGEAKQEKSSKTHGGRGRFRLPRESRSANPSRRQFGVLSPVRGMGWKWCKSPRRAKVSPQPVLRAHFLQTSLVTGSSDIEAGLPSFPEPLTVVPGARIQAPSWRTVAPGFINGRLPETGCEPRRSRADPIPAPGRDWHRWRLAGLPACRITGIREAIDSEGATPFFLPPRSRASIPEI